MAAFLQNYVDSVTDLPAELSRCFLLIQELDQKSKTLQTQIEDRCRKHVLDHTAEYEAALGTESAAKRTRLSSKGSPTKESALEAKRASQSEALDRDVRQVINYADEKVAVAQQIYDYVDQRIRRLDKDLKAFDAELTKDRVRQGLPDDDPNAAAAALDSLFPDTLRKNKNKKKGGQAAAAVSALVDAGTANAIPAAVDPSEPVYCYCQRVSFGEMIACDNEDCAIEWFHFECVGLTPENRPKGKWYCKECIQLKKASR
ncbi:hypothetical protein WJX79_008923 [Trebouxia sp. C0005]